MRIEATVQEIRALLQLTQLDARATELPPETYGSRREASRRRVSSVLDGRYQMLFHTGRSPVIVAIERGNCSGCHVRLPTMVEYQARRSLAVYICPHCRRMLYAPELLGERGTWAADTEEKATPRRAVPASPRER